jgi:hypothetical protein
MLWMARAAYMRQYRKDSKERERQKAFLSGFQALKSELTTAFLRIGKGELTGYTALEIVRNTEATVSRETSR